MTAKKGNPLSFDDVIELHKELLELAIELNHLRKNQKFQIYTKYDGSPVTDADLYSHKTLTSYFFKKLPHFSIISEEMDSPESAIPSHNTLFLDPIDGTKHFIEGKNPYFCLIGFAEFGIPTQGVHFRMDNGEIIFNIHNQVFHRTKDGETTIQRPEKQPDFILSMKMLDSIQKQKFSELNYRRDKYQYAYLEMIHPLFSSSAGMISRRRTWFWDICAPAAIMRAAGYKFTMFDENNNMIDFERTPIFADWWSCLHRDHISLNNQFI